MTKPPPQVVFPMLALSSAGGVRIMCVVANELASRGITVEIIAPASAATPPIPLHDNIELSIYPGYSSSLRYMYRVSRELRRRDALAISTGYLTPVIIHAGGIPFKRMNMFSIIQGYEPDSHIRYGHRPRWIRPLLHLAARMGYRLPGYKIAVSSFVAGRVGGGHVNEVINPGIGQEYIEVARALSAEGLPPPRDTSEPLVVGVFPFPAPGKGLAFALQAFSSLKSKRANVRPVVFDRDFPCDHIPAWIERFSNICRDNGQHTIIDFYRTCNVFLYPSLVEGFPLGGLEAMACGAVPVLADCGGVHDYGESGRNCLIVPRSDPEAISEALQTLAEDAQLLAQIRANGLENAQRYPEEKFARKCADAIAAQMDRIR